MEGEGNSVRACRFQPVKQLPPHPDHYVCMFAFPNQIALLLRVVDEVELLPIPDPVLLDELVARLT